MGKRPPVYNERAMTLRARTTITIACCAALYAAFVATAAAAQTAASRTIWNGVFNADQAKRGEASAARNCAKCHSADLAGGQDGPALVGADVLQAWNGMTVGELFDRVRTTMPADAPRSLSPQETADVVAFILSLNKCPAGEKELPSEMDALGQIRITSQP
jgi:mono/diheme cytochrome c family protein